MESSVADDLRVLAKTVQDRMAQEKQDRRNIINKDIVGPEYERVIEAAKTNAARGEFELRNFVVFDLSDDKRFSLEDSLGDNFLNIALDLLIEKLIKDGFVNVDRSHHSLSEIMINMGW
jgi:hypothetical protein